MIPKLALIGCGAIGTEVLSRIDAAGTINRLAGILVRTSQLERLRGTAAGRFAVVDGLDALLELRPDLVVECAGHAAVSDLGIDVLRQGTDLPVTSVGALADDKLFADLCTATQSGARLLIHSGAIAGIDGLRAARDAGLVAVRYSSIKPPQAWKATPAEKLIDLSAQREPAVFFDGTAREAALRYPQNAKVGATIAFAGIGLDRTRVKFVSDPRISGPLGIIEAESRLGNFRFEILAFASKANPKTSLLAAHSIITAVDSGWVFSPFENS